MRDHGKMLLKVSALLLAVFVLGSATGAAIDGIYRARASADSRVLSMRDGEAYFETLQRQLKLNAVQASSIRLILDRTRDDYKGICAETRPRYDALRGQARMQMRALLTPEQQQRFDDIVTQENCNCPDPRK